MFSGRSDAQVENVGWMSRDAAQEILIDWVCANASFDTAAGTACSGT
jgi:hypothetical protein